MLRHATDLEKFEVRATDGAIGRVRDFIFDERRWVVRYFVVATSSTSNRSEVLISPVSLSGPDWLERFIPVALTRPAGGAESGAGSPTPRVPGA